MKVNYASNGDPDRIPKVGDVLPISEHVRFKVEGYGESWEEDYPPSPTGKIYIIELTGVLVIPAGTPLEVLDDLFKGKL